MVQRPPHRLTGDLVKLDPPRISEAKHLGQVPGDRLALAIGVGGQDHGGPVLDRLLQVVDGLLAVSDHAVAGPEVVLDVDRQLPLRQIADVTH
jgi:hypothetical protein